MSMNTTRIVVLDGFTANPGDLDWGPLAALGNLTVHERTAAGEVVARVAGAEVVLTNKVVLNAETLAALPGLRYIGVLATGTNVIDLPAAARHGIVVKNVPGYSTPSVAEHTIGLMLELAHGIGALSAEVRAGVWSRSADFCFGHGGMRELAGRTLGLMGVGAIGRTVGAIARAMGLRTIGCTLRGGHHEGVQSVDRDTLLRESDVLSLHCPLTEATARTIDDAALRRLRPGALLINTARGGLVDEAAVAAALREDRLGGYAADVLSTEPPSPANPLLTAPRCILTPHVGWATRESRRRLIAEAAANLAAWAGILLLSVVPVPVSAEETAGVEIIFRQTFEADAKGVDGGTVGEGIGPGGRTRLLHSSSGRCWLSLDIADTAGVNMALSYRCNPDQHGVIVAGSGKPVSPTRPGMVSVFGRGLKVAEARCSIDADKAGKTEAAGFDAFRFQRAYGHCQQSNMPPTPGEEWAVAAFGVGNMYSNDSHRRAPAEQHYTGFSIRLNGKTEKTAFLDLGWILVWRGTDKVAPSVPSGFRLGAEEGMMSFAWQPADDNLLVAYYEILRREGEGWTVVTLSTMTALRLPAAELPAGDYAVRAVDVAENRSAPSAALRLPRPEAAPAARGVR
jgi:glycerate dehydrogenase